MRAGDLRQVLLVDRAEVLDQRRLDRRRLAALHHAGDGDRHLAQRPQAGDQAAEDRRGALGRLAAEHAHQFAQDVEVLHEALGPGAFEGELAGDLQPAVALVADQAALGDEGVVEGDLVPVVAAGEVDDRPDGDARRLEVDQELAQPLVAVAVLARGAHQRDAVVVAMRARGPDLGAVDAEAARHRLGAGAHRGEVGARIGLAHADREVAFAGGDAAAGSPGAAPRCRSAAAAGPTGGRPPSARRRARCCPEAPR